MTLFELDLPKAHEQAYLKLVKDGLFKRIDNGVQKNKNHVELTPEVKEILIPGYLSGNPDYKQIERLLIAEPEELKKLNDKLMKKINQLPADKQPKENYLEYIFNYGGVLNSTDKRKAYKVSKMIGVNTCPYCNRQYTFTIVEADEDEDEKEGKISRPAFDHWFPKSSYPLMSISLYNLIPSCTVCNSSAKGQTDMNLKEYIHPYVHKSSHPQIKFKAVPSTLPDRKWSIKIERKDNTPEDKTINLFKLDDVYRYHDLLELKDIMDFRENYPDGFLDDLVTLIEGKQAPSKGSKLTRADVYRMLFGVEWDDEKHLDRPFGKLKKDILKEVIK